MDTGGFAHCADCGEYLWIGGDTDGLCALCVERAAKAEPEPEPEPEPIVETEPPSVVKGVRKAVRRAYDTGGIGAKPKRSEIISLARVLWTDLSQHERDRLAAELQAKGRDAADPFDALVDYCQAVVRKRRARST